MVKQHHGSICGVPSGAAAVRDGAEKGRLHPSEEESDKDVQRKTMRHSPWMSPPEKSQEKSE